MTRQGNPLGHPRTRCLFEKPVPFVKKTQADYKIKIGLQNKKLGLTDHFHGARYPSWASLDHFCRHPNICHTFSRLEAKRDHHQKMEAAKSVLSSVAP